MKLAFRGEKLPDGALLETDAMATWAETKDAAVVLPVDARLLGLSGVGGYHSRCFQATEVVQAGTLGKLTIFGIRDCKRLNFAAEIEMLSPRDGVQLEVPEESWVQAVAHISHANGPKPALSHGSGRVFFSQMRNAAGEISKKRFRAVGYSGIDIPNDSHFEIALYGVTNGARLIWGAVTLS
jgi:hypothetical protein